MCSWLPKSGSTLWRHWSRYVRLNRDDSDEDSLGADNDALLWSKNLEKHSCGEFSYAVVQANEVIEDHSQVETGCYATFVGIYDGHGGPDASKYICGHLFQNLLKLAQEKGTISEGVLKGAFSATEDEFLSFVRRAFGIKPLIAAVGSCCLVGVIWKGTLHIANLGDSRAVLGSVGRSKKVVAEQLTTDHNVSVEEVRREVRSLHPDDSQVVVMKDGAWRIKGIIQISRSIGDAYLKRPEFSLDSSFPRFHLAKPLKRPVLDAVPSVCTRILQPNDKFIIFASDGLWEFLSNQEAVEIVYKNSRMEIARRLIRSALAVAAKKRNISYDLLKTYEKGNRRPYHDDISVVVLFIDHEMLGNQASTPGLSIRGFIDAVGPSNIQILDRIYANVNPEALS